MFGNGSGYVGGAPEFALFLCSSALAVGHVVVAYRTSCRERRKLLVYKIDIEAVSVHTPTAFPSHINFLIIECLTF